MEDLIPLITQVGFPAVMCIWFMFRMEKVINNNTQVLSAVYETINYCKSKRK